MKIDDFVTRKRPLLGLAIITIVSLPWWFGMWRIGELVAAAVK